MWVYIILSCISILFRFSYLLVPLYDLYCQRTGYGGTIKSTISKNPLEFNTTKLITIDFQSSIQTNFPIEFKPRRNQITTRLGKPTLAFYIVQNLTNDLLYGVRTYNVTPRKAAPYFHKLECFCFDEQRIMPNEKIEMPILFYIDPEILKENGNDIKLISINYTFYKVI